MTPGRTLAVDFGDKRTGVAVSDPFGWIAHGVEAVEGAMDAAARRIADMAKEYGVKTIVIGKPLNMDGSAGHRVERTEQFAKRLSLAVGDGVEVIGWDERLTTVQATRALRESAGSGGRTRGKSKGTVDIVSASILLQSYLDSKRSAAADNPRQA